MKTSSVLNTIYRLQYRNFKSNDFIMQSGSQRQTKSPTCIWLQMPCSVAAVSVFPQEAERRRSNDLTLNFMTARSELLALLSIFKTTTSHRGSSSSDRAERAERVCESQRRFDRLQYSESGPTRLKPTDQNAAKKEWAGGFGVLMQDAARHLSEETLSSDMQTASNSCLFCSNLIL